MLVRIGIREPTHAALNLLSLAYTCDVISPHSWALTARPIFIDMTCSGHRCNGVRYDQGMQLRLGASIVPSPHTPPWFLRPGRIARTSHPATAQLPCPESSFSDPLSDAVSDRAVLAGYYFDPLAENPLAVLSCPGKSAMTPLSAPVHSPHYPRRNPLNLSSLNP